MVTSARVISCPVAGEPGEIQLGEQLLEPGPSLFLGEVEGLQDGQEILLDGELPEHRRLLGQITHAQPAALVHGEVRHLLPLEEDPAPVGLEEAHDHVEGRGLARAVRPEKPHHLAAVDVEAYPIHHDAVSEALSQPLGYQTFHITDISARLGQT